MGIELLFGLLIVALFVAWGLWLFWITRQNNAGIIGGAILVFVLAGVIVFVNGERQDDQRADYGEQLSDYLGELEAAQEEQFESEGAYAEEPPELSDEVTAYDGGILRNEKGLEADIDVEKRGYTATVSLEGEEYTISVTRSASGELTVERTCEASAETGCEDGVWSAPEGSN